MILFAALIFTLFEEAIEMLHFETLHSPLFRFTYPVGVCSVMLLHDVKLTLEELTLNPEESDDRLNPSGCI